MKRILQVFCAVFSGLLLAAAIPNAFLTYGSPVIGMAALVPLYIALSNAGSYRWAALLCAIDAFTAHLASSWWLANFKDFAGFTLGASAVGTGCIQAVAGLILYMPFSLDADRIPGHNAFCRDGFMNADGFKALWFASAYTLYEWLKSTGFLAYPWGTLPMTAFNSKPIIQTADIFGTYGITFLFALTSAAIVQFIRNNDFTEWKQKKIHAGNTEKAALLIFLIFNAYGLAKYHEKRIPEKILNAVLVQQDQDPWKLADDTKSIEISKSLTVKGIKDFHERGIEPDLIVWTEGVLRFPFPQSYARYISIPEEEPLISFIMNTKIPFVIGAPYTLDYENRKYCNSAILFDRYGSMRGFYGKRHLVPFAEVVPGMDYQWVRKAMTRIIGFSNCWTPGPSTAVFDIPAKYSPDIKTELQVIDISRPYAGPDATSETLAGKKTSIRLSFPICFEDAFPDICADLYKAGTEIFMNITDDSWSLTEVAEYQHFVVACYRAIEFRTTFVRATNAGVTAVIDPAGKITDSLPLFVQDALSVQIPSYRRTDTVYAEYTDWFCKMLLLFVILSCWIEAAAIMNRKN